MPFSYQFEDDIVAGFPEDKKDAVTDTLNKFETNIQFTVERKSQMTMPFLDTRSVRFSEGNIRLDRYQKVTAISRYINYNSYHPTNQEIIFMKNMKEKILNVTSPDYQKSNLNKLKNILINENCPSTLIKKLIFSRIIYCNKSEIP